MKRLFWILMIGISGALLGISLSEFIRQDTGEFTIYLFIAGLILVAINAWGTKKYLGMGFFSNKPKNDS